MNFNGGFYILMAANNPKFSLSIKNEKKVNYLNKKRHKLIQQYLEKKLKNQLNEECILNLGLDVYFKNDLYCQECKKQEECSIYKNSLIDEVKRTKEYIQIEDKISFLEKEGEKLERIKDVAILSDKKFLILDEVISELVLNNMILLRDNSNIDIDLENNNFRAMNLYLEKDDLLQIIFNYTQQINNRKKDDISIDEVELIDSLKKVINTLDFNIYNLIYSSLYENN